MATAITFVAIFVVSFTIVMRLTGLSQNVATFQCISALSGTGFTTSESEMIVNYPVRRRILIVLML
ncbi:MAG: potassium transporter TrkA, partial [Pseudomonadota bacterium]|nr:potassium transporter TrkA [Pseudomonadota bacterium]